MVKIVCAYCLELIDEVEGEYVELKPFQHVAVIRNDEMVVKDYSIKCCENEIEDEFE